MKTHVVRAAGAAAVSILLAAACTREEPQPAPVPPPPAASAPVAPPPPITTGPASAPATSTTPATSTAPGPDGPAERAGRVIGEQIDDATVTAKVKAALLQAKDVKGLDVTVETEKSVVQLSGFVASAAEAERAVQIARGIAGVKEVQNKMSVKPGK